MVIAILGLVLIGSGTNSTVSAKEIQLAREATPVAANYHLHNRSRNAFEGVPQRDRYRTTTMRRMGKHS